jgi:hypothetical protein
MPLYLAILKHVNSPTDKWAPYEMEYRTGRYEFKKRKDINEKSFDNLAFEDSNEMKRF